MSHEFEYIIEETTDPAQLRVFRMASESGSLLVPQCVADLKGISRPGSLDPLIVMLTGRSNPDMNDGQPSIKPADLESAIKSVIEFISNNISDPDNGLTFDQGFQEVLIETVKQNSPQEAMQLSQLINRSKPSLDDDLHTGFYL